MEDLHVPRCSGLKSIEAFAVAVEAITRSLGSRSMIARVMGALPHYTDDVERLKARDKSICAVDMVVECSDGRSPVDRRPVRH